MGLEDENRIIKELGITTDGKERLFRCQCGKENYFSNSSCWSCGIDLRARVAELNKATKGFSAF